MSTDRKPPFNVQVLQRWVGQLAREQGIAPGRVQRWISFMVVAATLQLEVAAAEGDAGREIDRVPGKPLDALGIDTPADVPCVSIRYQIAQKLHACTEVPADGRENDRFRDLIDLLLLEELVEEDEWPTVREACEEIFRLRARHPWPPTVTVYETWPDPYGALAAELGFQLVEVKAAANAVQAMIGRIAEARS